MIDIDSITIGQARQIATAFGNISPAKSVDGPDRDLGQNIVVLDRGFVYVGNVIELPDRVIIRNAKNIRVWGTTKGLGELREGPLTGTKLDVVGEVIAYRAAIIHFVPCKGF